MFRASRRIHLNSFRLHENPLGLPRNARSPQAGIPIKQKIPNVSKVILVSSAKGGVGKSTISANLALALKHAGRKVGLLDADIFGPSVPTIMNLKSEPRMTPDGRLIPLSNYGVETMSMGYMIKPENPIVWRGLMVMKAIQQLLFEVAWSPLDFLIIDMPPGTGDTQLSITQHIKVEGSLIVTTPQEISLVDAIKGVSMFHKVKVPIFGLIQNMSYYVCPNCNHESHIFGLGSVEREAKRHKLEILGSIPLNEKISMDADNGKPTVVADPDSPLAVPYLHLANRLLEVCTK